MKGYLSERDMIHAERIHACQDIKEDEGKERDCGDKGRVSICDIKHSIPGYLTSRPDNILSSHNHTVRIQEQNFSMARYMSVIAFCQQPTLTSLSSLVPK